MTLKWLIFLRSAQKTGSKAIEEEHYYDDLMNEMMEGDHHSPFLFSLEHGLKYTRFRDYCSLKYTRFRDYSVIKVANSIGEYWRTNYCANEHMLMFRY